MSNHSSRSKSSSKKSRKTSNKNELFANVTLRKHQLVTPSTKAADNSIESGTMMDVSSIERDPRAHSHSLLSLDDSIDSILQSPAPRTSTPMKDQKASRKSRKSKSLYKRTLINQAEKVQSPRPQKERDQRSTQSRSRSRSRSVRIPHANDDSSNYDTAPESLNSTRATNEESYRRRDATQRALFHNLNVIDQLNGVACAKPSITDLASMAKCVLITPLSVHTSQEVNVIAVTGQILITTQTLIRSSRASSNIRALMNTLLTSIPAIRNESNLADIDHENEKSIHKVFVGDDSVLIERVSTIHRGRDRNSFDTDDRRTYRFVCHGDLLTNDPISDAKPRYLTVHAETSTSKDVDEIEKSERIILAFDKSSSTKKFNHSQTGISLVHANILPSEGPVRFDEHVRVSELSQINIVKKVNINANDRLWNEPRIERREQRLYKLQNVESIDDDDFEPVKIVRSQSLTRTRSVKRRNNESILGPLREKSSSTEKRRSPSVQPPHKASSADEDTSAGSSASSSEQLRTPSAGSPKPETSVTTLTHDKQPINDCDRTLDVTQNSSSPAPKHRDPVSESPVRTAVPADKSMTLNLSTHELTIRPSRSCRRMMQKNASSIRTIPASGRVLKSTASLTELDNRESVTRPVRRALSVDQMHLGHQQYPKAPSPPLPSLLDRKATDEKIADCNSHRPVPRPRSTSVHSRVVPAAPPVSGADGLTPQKEMIPKPPSGRPVPAPRSISRPPVHHTLPSTESKIVDASNSQSSIQKRTINVPIISNPEDCNQGEFMTKKLTLETIINGHKWHLTANFVPNGYPASEISFVPKRIRLEDKTLWEETENWSETSMGVTNTTTGPRTIGRSSSDYEHSVQVQAPPTINQSVSTIRVIGEGVPAPSISSTQTTLTEIIDLSSSQSTVTSKSNTGSLSSSSSKK